MRTAYAATKHAQMGFFDSLRVELRDDGVSVTVIAPYFVQSEIRRRSPGPDGRTVEASPVKEAEIMSAEECARLMVRAMERRQRMLVMSFKGKLGRWAKLVARASWTGWRRKRCARESEATAMRRLLRVLGWILGVLVAAWIGVCAYLAVTHPRVTFTAEDLAGPAAPLRRVSSGARPPRHTRSRAGTRTTGPASRRSRGRSSAARRAPSPPTTGTGWRRTWPS